MCRKLGAGEGERFAGGLKEGEPEGGKEVEVKMKEGRHGRN